jgi:hypothetical protein
MLFIANKLIIIALSKILVSLPPSPPSPPHPLGLIFITNDFLPQPSIAQTFNLPMHNQIGGKPAQ